MVCGRRPKTLGITIKQNNLNNQLLSTVSATYATFRSTRQRKIKIELNLFFNKTIFFIKLKATNDYKSFVTSLDSSGSSLNNSTDTLRIDYFPNIELAKNFDPKIHTIVPKLVFFNNHHFDEKSIDFIKR